MQNIFDLIKPFSTVHIFGDYDTDGILGTLVATKAIKHLYPDKEVVPYIPKRSEGYGINADYVSSIKDGIIITVDNGIAAQEIFKNASVPFIVTDHHNGPDYVDGSLATFSSPVCYPGDSYSGCALFYKLCEESGYFPVSVLSELRTYAAITTITDMCNLSNRNGSWNLVHNEIKRLRSMGLPKSLAVFVDKKEFITEDTFGFSIGPVINAAGRMLDDGGMQMFHYLNGESDHDHTYFTSLNSERKSLTKEFSSKEFIDSVLGERKPFDKKLAPFVACVDAPHGILGLIAQEITQKAKMPAIILSTPDENGVCKGSMRGFGNEFSCSEYLNKNRSLLLSGGGHTNAAGLSLKYENVEKLSKEEFTEPLIKITPADTVEAGDIASTFFTEDNNMPYGVGNPKPIHELTIDTTMYPTTFTGDTLKVDISSGVQALWYKYGKQNKVPELLTVCGTVGMNTFMGRTKTTFTIQ